MNVAAPALPELRPLTTRIAFRDDVPGGTAPSDMIRYVDVKPDITQFGGRENGGRGWSQFTSLDDAVAAAQRVSNPTGDSTNLTPYAVVHMMNGQPGGQDYYALAPASVVEAGSVTASDVVQNPFKTQWHGYQNEIPGHYDSVRTALGGAQAIISRPAHMPDALEEVCAIAVGEQVTRIDGDQWPHWTQIG